MITNKYIKEEETGTLLLFNNFSVKQIILCLKFAWRVFCALLFSLGRGDIVVALTGADL